MLLGNGPASEVFVGDTVAGGDEEADRVIVWESVTNIDGVCSLDRVSLFDGPNKDTLSVVFAHDSNELVSSIFKVATGPVPD